MDKQGLLDCRHISTALMTSHPSDRIRLLCSGYRTSLCRTLSALAAASTKADMKPSLTPCCSRKVSCISAAQHGWTVPFGKTCCDDSQAGD